LQFFSNQGNIKLMSSSLRNHLSSSSYNLPESIVDEVCSMFAEEAQNLLNALTGLKPEVRTVALGALRDYYSTIEKINNPVFTQVATVMSSVPNDPQFQKAA
jgi:hypothetical protein